MHICIYLPHLSVEAHIEIAIPPAEGIVELSSQISECVQESLIHLLEDYYNGQPSGSHSQLRH